MNDYTIKEARNAWEGITCIWESVNNATQSAIINYFCGSNECRQGRSCF